MIKVALLHFCFEDYTIELANGLARYVDLTLIQPDALSEACKNMLAPGIQVRCFKKFRIRDLRNVYSMREMIRLIRSVQPDVLHVQETNDPWYDLTLLLNKKMPPLITTIHDIFRHPGDRHSVFGSEYTKRISFYRSQQIIVHTQALRQTLIETFKCPPERVQVLPHGELGSLYFRQSQKKSILRELYTLLFFGRIWPYKGLKYLISAMPLVAEHIPNVKLIIAGRGESLGNYFPDGYDEKRYEILDTFIPPQQVVNLFQRSTAVVLPYTESSQSGVATLAYAMGTPVIASNVGGLSELIRHGEDGLLVPPCDVSALANAIIKLLESKDMQHKLRISALARCQDDLSWSNIAAQTTEVYHKVIGRKS